MSGIEELVGGGAAGGGASATTGVAGLGAPSAGLGGAAAGTGTVLAPTAGTGAAGIAGLGTPAAGLGGAGAGTGTVLGGVAGPGYLSQVGQGLGAAGKAVVNNPGKSANLSMQAYKELREDLRPGPLAPTPHLAGPQPIQAPQFGPARAALSPAQRLQLMQQQGG